jgi:hypothetical protein
MTVKRTETEHEEDCTLDVEAQKALIARTRTMSDREMLEYLSDTIEKAAHSRPQRNTGKRVHA